MFAVIKTGGKQYKVAANDVLKIEKLPAEAGDIVTFDEVLMVGDGGEVTVGAPLVEGALVAAELLDTKKQKTIIILKKHRRQHYDRRNGHRQLLSSVRITEILTGGAQPSIPARAKAVAAPADDVSETPAKSSRKGRAGAPGHEAEITEVEPVTHIDVTAPATEDATPEKKPARKAAAQPAEGAAPEAKAKKPAAPRKPKSKAEDQE